MTRPIVFWKRRLTNLSALIVLASIGCNFQELKPSQPSGNAQLVADSSKPTDFEWLQDRLFAPSCIKCHNSGRAAGGVNLEAPRNLLTGKSPSGNALILPGRCEESAIFQAIVSGRMPPGGQPISPDIVGALRIWIESGADPMGHAIAVALPGEGNDPLPNAPAPTPRRPAHPIPEPQPGTPPPAPSPSPEPGVDPTPVVVPPVEVVAFAEVQTKIFAPLCSSCHDAEILVAGIDLTSYDAIMHGTVPLIVVGDAAQSPVYKAVKTGGMPMGGAPLSQELLTLLSNWINQGAKP